VAPAAERPLAELLAAVAERSPAPGGGSAAAWCGAFAAALLEMSSGFAEAADAVRHASVLRGRLLDAGEAELRSYEPVLSAVRLPADDPRRAERLASSLSAASEAPLEIARAAAEVAELAASVAANSKPALRGDAVAGVVLAEAAVRAAAHLIEVNLHERMEDPRRAEAAALSERTSRVRADVLARFD
jgi:formiminotetrahydrofolate cyclodeaminase